MLYQRKLNNPGDFLKGMLGSETAMRRHWDLTCVKLTVAYVGIKVCLGLAFFPGQTSTLVFVFLKV